MPNLWDETIEAHRHEVRNAVLDTTAALVAEQGLLGVTMTQIAAETGIGRATLYRYFSGVEEIVDAWHERQVAGHLQHLAAVRDAADGPAEKLEAVLAAYGGIHHHRVQHHRDQPHGGELAAFLHRDEQLGRAAGQLRDMIQDLLSEAAEAGEVRRDVTPGELADYCLHALEAASSLSSEPAIQRLVGIILDGLRPPAE